MRFNLRIFAATACSAHSPLSPEPKRSRLCWLCLAARRRRDHTRAYYYHRYYDEAPSRVTVFRHSRKSCLGDSPISSAALLGATFYGYPYVRPVYASAYYGGPVP